MTRRIPPGAPVLTAAAMREAERVVFDQGISRDELMERAGLAVARVALRLAGPRPILVLAGPGNNGGDAFVAARYLLDWGRDVVVARLGTSRDGAAARMAARWVGPAVTFERAPARPFLIDGLFGTGVTRPLDASVMASFQRLCAQAFTLAIDLPSGIPADIGASDPSLIADVTIALGALKPAHLIGPATGDVILTDIGVPVTGRWRTIAQPVLHAPDHDAHKFSRGMVAIVGGAMSGAAALASAAALHGGAGYVLLLEREPTAGPPHAIVRRTIASPAELTSALADPRIGAVLIGPGLGRDADARDRLDAALASPHPLILDGDALSLLGPEIARVLAARAAPAWLTPHAGEFDRIAAPGGIKIDRTLAAARATGATIVHKGAETVIADPAGRVTIAATGTPWLSTAGTGDVLAGLLAARVAARDPNPASTAVWLHGRAARHAGAAFAAEDLVPHIPFAIAECIAA